MLCAYSPVKFFSETNYINWITIQEFPYKPTLLVFCFLIFSGQKGLTYIPIFSATKHRRLLGNNFEMHVRSNVYLEIWFEYHSEHTMNTISCWTEHLNTQRLFIFILFFNRVHSNYDRFVCAVVLISLKGQFI